MTSPHDAQRARYQRPWCSKRRVRKPSVRSMIKDAEKDGKKVTAVSVTPEGVTLTFGEQTNNDPNPWERAMQEPKQ
jgi:hypothetical protein